MKDALFEMKLPIAMPTSLKSVLTDTKGRQYFMRKLFEASFRVTYAHASESIDAIKQDPSRSYGFLFNSKDILFSTKVYSETISNPHRFFLDTLLGELSTFIDLARDFLENHFDPDSGSSRNPLSI